MRIVKQKISTFPKSLPLLLLVVVLLGLLWFLWSVQKNNVNSLARQIDGLKQQINALPAEFSAKDRLTLEKDRLTLEKDRVNAENAVYATLVQTFGAAFIIVTAYFAYRNVKAIEANVKATEANVRAAEEKQVTERFSKAIELLGSEKIEVRLGGIYALERIAKDSPKDHWTIVEILTSFIREKTTLVEPNSKAQSFPNFQKLTSEVQAALTVIKRRDYSTEQDWQRIELQNTNLRRARLDEAKLMEARLNGANLIEAALVGADLRKAWLLGADLRFANLFGANLHRAKLDEANLFGADLLYANLSGAWLYKANLSEVNLGEARLDGAVLYKANLTGANLTEAILYKANLKGADLSGAIGLTQEEISKATTDEETKLPDYLQAPKPSQPELPES